MTRMRVPDIVRMDEHGELTATSRTASSPPPRFLLDVAFSLSFLLSLSLYYINSLHTQPARGALVISASQFVSSWSFWLAVK